MAASDNVSLWRLFALEFSRDNLLLRSSALAFSTLMSLVPVFAIVLAILSGPAFMQSREQVINTLAETLVPQDTKSEESWIVDDVSPQNDLKETFRRTVMPLAEKAGAVGIFGFLLLAVTVGMLFRTVENSFNAIWRVRRWRSFFMRVAIATGLIFWGPVLLAVSVSLTEWAAPLRFLGTYLLPTLFTTIAFTAFYMIMPHVRVRFRCALIGGAAAALCWELAKLLFLIYVTRVVSFHKVYGSLGLIPMLFLWVYVNWVVVLSGAELAYCLQFRDALAQQWREARGSLAGDEHIAPALVLALAIEVVRRFQQPETAGVVRVSQLADALQVEPAQAREAAQRLVAAKILAQVAPPENSSAVEDCAYLPACEPKACDVSALLVATRNEPPPANGSAAWQRAHVLLTEASRAGEQRLKGLTLSDLAGEQFALTQSSSGLQRTS